MKTITLKEFHQQLKELDWYYQFSDCSVSRKRAILKIEKYKKFSQSHPVLKKVFTDVSTWTKKRFKQPQLECPKCPKIHMEFSWKID